MRTLDLIIFVGGLIFFAVWYVPMILNELGRETGIIWCCGTLILYSLPFYFADKSRKNIENPTKR